MNITKICLKLTLEFLDQINPNFQSKKNENHHQILHIQINLGSKFQLQQTILTDGTNFQKKYTFGQKPKKSTSP